LPESGIDQINEEAKPGKADALSSHLLGGKKHHDEEKNVETEEIQHLEKGTDYLTTLLLIIFNTEGLLMSVSIKITFQILENAKAVFRAIVVFPSPE